jgi:hypothetical protein
MPSIMTNSVKGGAQGSARGSAKGSAVKAFRTPPPLNRQSPSCSAKTKATASINRLYAPHPMVPVAEVVAMPPSSSPLTTSHAVSERGLLTVGSKEDSDGDNDSSESNQFSEICHERIAGKKTTGLLDLGNDLGSVNSSDVVYVGEGANDDPQLLDDDDMPTNAKVSMYFFHQRLKHYLEGIKISQQNRKAVELVIFVEAGTFVRNMDLMKKSNREEVLLSKYMNIINEIEDVLFEDDSVWVDMLNGYMGTKKELLGPNLLRKLDVEMRDVRKFAAKFPGFNNPSELPSGTTQLRHMKKPVIIKLWKKKYLVILYFFDVFFPCLPININVWCVSAGYSFCRLQ